MFKKKLLFSSPASLALFTNHPTNFFEVGRLVRGLPCWKKASEASFSKKRTIIYNRLAQSTDTNYIEILAERLDNLLLEGFAIYSIEDNLALTKVERCDIESLIQEKGLYFPSDTDLAAHAAKQLNVSYEEIFILNDEECKALVQGDETDYSNQINPTEIDLTNSLISLPSLIQLLSIRKDTLITLDLSGCINFEDVAYRKMALPPDLLLPHLEILCLRLTFPEGLWVKKSKHPNIPFDLLKQLLESTQRLRIFRIDTIFYHAEIIKFIQNPENLEILDLGKRRRGGANNFDNQALQTILKRALNLKKLILGFSSLTLPSLFEGIILPELQTLRLRLYDLNNENLACLLKHAPLLRKLELELDSAIPKTLFQGLTLPFLETLEIYSGASYELDINTFSLFLSHSPLLKTLKLDGPPDIEACFKNLKLQHLEILELSDFTMRTEAIIDFLKSAPQLKRLRLPPFTDISKKHLLELPLSKLEKLTLKSLNLTSKLFIQILEKTQQLKSLDINDCQDFKHDSALQTQFELPLLEDISFFNVSIDLNILEWLISVSPNLKKLNLKYCIFSGKIARALEIKGLTNFLLSVESPLDPVSIFNILNQATQLKELSLSSSFPNSKGLSSFPILLPPTNFTVLDNLNFTIVTLDPTPFMSFLDKAPRLNKVEIETSQILGHSHPLQTTVRMNRLKNFSLYVENPSKHDLNFLNILFNCSPNLIRLSLKNLTFNSFSSRWPKNNKLNKLSLSEGSLDLRFLNTLLDAFPSLEKLSLRTVKCLRRSNATLSHPKLRQINLKNSYLSTGQILSILKHTPQCKKLHLGSNSPINIEELKQSLPSSISIRHKISNNIPSSFRNLISTIKCIPSIAFISLRKLITIDADTKKRSKPTNVKQLFYALNSKKDPEVRDYREHVRQKLSINPISCEPEEAFELSCFPEDKQLKLLSMAPSSKESWQHLQKMKSPTCEKLFYGKQLLVSDSEWQALASLSVADKLLSYHLSDNSIKISIAYSERDNLYYVQHHTGVPLNIDFIISVPPLKKANDLPRVIKKKIDSCKSFGSKALKSLPSSPTGQDYLKAITTQKVGACRHRSVIFKAWMDECYPDIPVRIVLNQCHAYVELYWKNNWFGYDLGGYPGKLNIDKTSGPSLEQKSNKSSLKAYAPQKEPLTASVLPPPVPQAVSSQSTATLQQPKLSYTERLLASSNKKLLVEFSDNTILQAVKYDIQLSCHKSGQPFFYIDTPEHLICSSAYVERTGNKGCFKPGPGGRLYDFLIKYQEKHAVIVINYAHFTARDIVRFNTVIDKERAADGTALPEHIQIIGLINPDDPKAYQGADFYSRFNDVLRCPLKREDIPQLALPSLSPKERTANTFIIDFFGGYGWEERAFGFWSIEGNNLDFEEGLLINAVKSYQSIELRNAPWDNDAFLHLWQGITLYQKVLSPYGDVDIPSGVTFTQSQGYDWDLLKKSISLTNFEMLNEKTMVLNPTSLSQFFSRYECNNQNHTLKTTQGLIKQHRGQLITCFLTATLTEQTWAKLLSTCQEQQVHLSMVLAPNIKLPVQLYSNTTMLQPSTLVLPKQVWDISNFPIGDFALSSSDVDFSLTQLKTDIVVDISNVENAQLFSNIKAAFNQKQLKLTFKERESFLLKALHRGRSILLKGQFSSELQDALGALLLQRKADSTAPGQLILLSDTAQGFGLIPHYHQEISLSEKKTWLYQNYPTLTFQENEYQHSLTHLYALGQRRITDPKATPETVFQGLKTLPEDTSGVVYENRLPSVESALENYPIVFIGGPTGVGKTEFIYNIWSKQYPSTFIGEQATKAWALKRSEEKFITLVIDEATIQSELGQNPFSLFEALFLKQPNSSPTLFLDNQLLPLTTKHRIIFIGNPVSYGGERHLPTFLERHGNSLLFEPLPPDILYEGLLSSLLPDKSTAQPLLEMTDFLNKCASTEVLISPRELRTIALLIRSYKDRNPTSILIDVAYHYAYSLISPLVPETSLQAFKATFPTPRPINIHYPILEKICINSHNQEAFERIHDIIQISRDKKAEPHMRKGGINALLLEGQAGLGKSQLVFAVLLSLGYTEGNTTLDNSHQSVFYRIPVSMPLTEKEALLRKAFNEGAVVVIDELNAGPSMERLLNALLQEKTPEGKQARCPGFTLIATQNPPTLAGRNKPSNALTRRFLHTQISPYTPEEMTVILTHKGLDPAAAKQIVTAYTALQTTLSKSSFCFRSLVEAAEKQIQEKTLTLPLNSDADDKLIEDSVQSLTPLTLSFQANLQKLQDIANLTPEDEELKSFIQLKQTQFNMLMNDQHREKLNQTLVDAYNSLTSPAVQAIYQTIERLKKSRKMTDFFAHSAVEKAERIKRALLNVPVLDRDKILNQEEENAITLCKTLAEHRNVFSRWLHGSRFFDITNKQVNPTYAASAFKDLSNIIETVKTSETSNNVSL